MICKYCGKQIPDDSIFCFYCSKAVAPTSTTVKVKGGKERSSSGGSFSPNARKPIIIGIAIVLILALLGAVAVLFMPNIPAMRGQSETLSSEMDTFQSAAIARRGIPASIIVVALVALVVIVIIFLLCRRIFSAGLGKPILIGVFILLILAVIGFVIIRVFNIETPDSFSSGRQPNSANRLDDGSDSFNDDPYSEDVFGFESGDLCYGADLPIIDSNGETGATIDPTKTGKLTIIYFWGTWCSPCVNELPYYQQIAEEYGDDLAVIAIHSACASDSAPEFIADYYQYSPLIFSWETENIDDVSGPYYIQLGGRGTYPYIVILNEDGIIIDNFASSVSYETLRTIIASYL